jgi:ribosomal protein S18 acetylase RimI-like enzyme
MTPTITAVGGEAVDRFEPLWRALDDEHRQVGPTWPSWWSPDRSWAIRRSRYVQWLAEPDAFALLAELDDRVVGYLVLHFLDGPDDSWVTGRRIADIESLAVLPECRGKGVGRRLLHEARARIAAIGVHDLWIGVVAGNERALRFYEREGLRPLMVTLGSHGTSPGPLAE